MIATPFGPEPALDPALQLLIDRGILSRAASNDTREDVEAFGAELAGAIARGEVSPDQAETLSQMLGVRAA